MPKPDSSVNSTSEASLVSVVITAYNREDCIARAIASARAQDYSPIEIVVVDDASTDNTLAVISAAAGDDLRCVRNERNRGIAGAKNAGIEASRGEFVAFLDSDDEWMPGKLSAQMFALQQPKAPPLSFTAFYLRRESGHEVVRVPYRRKSWLDSSLRGISVGLGSTLVARRNLFEEVGPLNEDIRRIEDRDWILRYLEIYPDFLVEPRPMARIHNSGFPSSKTVKEGAAELLEANRERLMRRGPHYYRLFRASLQLEIAVAYYREGRRIRGLAEGARALVQSPSLASTILQRLKGKLKDADKV